MSKLTEEDFLSKRKEKNELVMKAMHEKDNMLPEDYRALEIQIACLEAEISGYHLDNGDVPATYANFLSMMTALKKAGCSDGVLQAYEDSWRSTLL